MATFSSNSFPGYLGINFCPECNNMLYPQEDKASRTLLYVCRNCQHKELAENCCVYINKVQKEVDELTQVHSDIAKDPTLPRSDHPCPKCGHKQSVFFQAYSRRSEEEMGLYYVCTNKTCGNKWSE
ncbi:DNA-directed RNA polymerase II subunit RPB9 [Chamberlinius hualienensis]